MKVREIEMILADMGAIDPENPEESLGENRTLQLYLTPFIFYGSILTTSMDQLQRTSTSTEQLI